MDLPKSELIDKIIEQADAAGNAGEYEIARDLLLPLLQRPNKKKMTTMQELTTCNLLASFYRLLTDYKSAFVYIERYLELTRQIFKPESREYAVALKMACTINRELGSTSKAHDNITKALDIMRKLKLQDDEQYGSMLSILATIKYNMGKYNKALKIYNKAKPLLIKHKDDQRYNIFLNDIALCHQKLNKWHEAINSFEECIKYNIELGIDNTLDHATTLWNFGHLYVQLGQYRDALPLLKDGLYIVQENLGENHDLSIYKSKILTDFVKIVEEPHHGPVIGDKFRMCNNCTKIQQNLDYCSGCCRTWYCNQECQLKDWLYHKFECYVCMNCNLVLEKPAEILKCQQCKNAKYCSIGCQEVDLENHKECCSSSGK